MKFKPPYLFAALLLALSLAGLWFAGYVAAPRVESWFNELGEPRMLPSIVDATLWTLSKTYAFFWPVVAAFTVLLWLACIPALTELSRSVTRWALVVFSVVGLAAVVLAYGSLYVATHDVYMAQRHRSIVYSTVLEELALRDVMENRFTEFEQRLRKIGTAVAVPVEHPESLSKVEQAQRIEQLLTYLDETNSSVAKRRILSTTYWFKESLLDNKKQTEIVLNYAKAEAGADFPNIAAFFAWLEPNLSKNAWVPIPLYKFKETTEAITPPIEPVATAQR
jgi:hypothetical protein